MPPSEKSDACLANARPRWISLWENRAFPPLDPVCRTGMPAQQRAWRHFAGSAMTTFYLDIVTHPQLPHMNRIGAFSGSFEHPRGHVNEFCRRVEVAGPGAHGLVFRKDWYSGSRFDKYFLHGLPPGILIVPNIAPSALRHDLAKRERIACLLWEKWEAATGSAWAEAEMRAEARGIIAHAVNA